jgi:cholinesterase
MKSVLLLWALACVHDAYANPQAPQAAVPPPGVFVPGQQIRAPAGVIVGTASKYRPLVSAYLGIRYAQPPVRSLRYMRPVKVLPATTPINARQHGPDCPTIIAQVNATLPVSPGNLKLLGAMAQSGNAIAEDCLYMNVWTKPQIGERRKAVVIFVHGGGFGSGAASNPLWDGSVLAEEQDIVVVSFNYRLGIFGFSGAPAPAPQNVGLMDVRMAIEWVRDNIASFGGDPERIVLMGQDAGAVAIDYYTYTYVYNTIAKGIILMSGEAKDIPPVNDNFAWYNVTSKSDCGGIESGSATIDCTRVRSMEDVLKNSEDTDYDSWTWLDTPFKPRVDGSLVFSDYSRRARRGLFAKVPMLIGNTNNEGGIYRLLPFSNPEFLEGVPPGVWDGVNKIGWTCPSSNSARARLSGNVPVWRYRYFGEFVNSVVTPAAGAWHGSELFTLFGTTKYVTNVDETPEQTQLGKYMRGAWGAFIRDPYIGLTRYNWPVYNPDSESKVQIETY